MRTLRSWSLAGFLMGTAIIGMANRPVYAGYWEEAPNPYEDMGPWDEDWREENAKRLEGNIAWNVPTSWVYDPAWANKSFEWKTEGELAAGFNGGNGFWGIGNDVGLDGTGHTGSHGTRKVLYKWVRNTDPLTGLEDEDDDPDDILKLKVTLSAYAEVVAPNNVSGAGHVLETTVAGKEGTVTNHGNGTVTSTAEKTFLVQIATHGQEEVWTPEFQYDAQIQAVFNDPNDDTLQYAGGVFSYAAQLDNRRLTITSTNSIENSYHKTSDATQPIDKYRDGVLPEASDLIGDIYAGLANERATNGDITLDSVAVWNPIANQWMGQGKFQANEVNFQSPTFHWLWSGGTALGTLSDDIIAGEEEINATPNFLIGNGVFLGGQRDGNGRQYNSNIYLKAVDGVDGTIAETKCTVNWHLPLEEIGSLGVIDEDTYLDENASSWDVLQRSVEITIQPRSVWWDIAGAGTGVAAVAAPMVFPQVTLTDMAVLALTGANLTITDSMPSAVTDYKSFGYAEYADALIKQYNKNNNVPGTENDADTFFASSAVLANCYATLKRDSNGNIDPGQAGSDPNYKNLLYQSRIALKKKWEKEKWRGFQYDIHGFKNYQLNYIKQDVQMLYVNQVNVP